MSMGSDNDNTSGDYFQRKIKRKVQRLSICPCPPDMHGLSHYKHLPPEVYLL